MKKGTLIGALVGVTLSVLLIGVMLNSHIDIYPGSAEQYSFITDQSEVVSTTVSLRDVFVYNDASLNFFGMLLAALVNLVLPAIAGLFIARAINKKSEKLVTV